MFFHLILLLFHDLILSFLEGNEIVSSPLDSHIFFSRVQEDCSIVISSRTYFDRLHFPPNPLLAYIEHSQMYIDPSTLIGWCADVLMSVANEGNG